MSGISDFTLERYRLGELPRDQSQQITQRVSQDDGLRRRLEALNRSDEAIRRECPPGVMARGVTQQADTPPASPAGAVMRWAVPVAAAAIVLLALVLPGVRTPRDTDRVKGEEAALLVYRNASGGSETLADNDVARPGDLIRVGYRTSAPQFGAIVSLDGRGVVTTHLPANGGEAIALQSGSTVLLDASFELDDAPRLERFYLVIAPSPFALAPVVDAIRKAGAAGATLSLPAPLHYTTFSLRKESRP